MYRDTATGGAGMGTGGGALGAGALGDTAKRTRSRALQYGAGCCDTARGVCGRERGARGTGSGHAAWGYCWAVGYALGTLSLFLTRIDSVLFLSPFLDIVCEPSS